MVGAWLAGILSQTDPRQYPKLDELIGEERQSKPADPKADAAEASSNARAWGMALKMLNRKANRQATKEE